MRKTTAQLQHEYLSMLLQTNKKMTVAQALNRCYILNQYRAGYLLQERF